MQTQRLGCLSPSAIISAVLTLVLILAVEILSGNSLFTAGALNAETGPALGGVNSHAELGGQCDACHTVPWSAQKMAERYLECHSAVQAELGNTTRLHGAILARNPTADCRVCHPEHRGPNASLTILNNSDFPHDLLGFSLAVHTVQTGNLPFACDDCHNTDLSAFNQQTCLTCHLRLDEITREHQKEGVPNFNDCLCCHPTGQEDEGGGDDD
jgi:hypothetical protein